MNLCSSHKHGFQSLMNLFSLELLEHSTRQRAPLCIVFSKYNQDHKLPLKRKKLLIRLNTTCITITLTTCTFFCPCQNGRRPSCTLEIKSRPQTTTHATFTSIITTCTLLSLLERKTTLMKPLDVTLGFSPEQYLGQESTRHQFSPDEISALC